jgi:hypothetical protein
MDFFSLFKKKQLVLLRCTHCYAEFELAQKPLHFLVQHNSHNSICPVSVLCDSCGSGFLIPVDFTDTAGNQYLYALIKEKINNLPDSHPFFEDYYDLDALSMILS